MIQTKKEGVLHKGKIRKAGELLSLPAQDEERLVREGWATFVEAWASAPAEQAAPGGGGLTLTPVRDDPSRPRR